MSERPAALPRLGKRARAMLREMGVRVWLPAPAPAAAEIQVPRASSARTPVDRVAGGPDALPDAVPVALPDAVSLRAVPPSALKSSPAQPPLTSAPPARRTAVAAPAAVDDAGATDQAAAWQLGQVYQPYLDLPPSAAPQTARWLVLAETPAAALRGSAVTPLTPLTQFAPSAPSAPFAPFAGEAGTLLANMLRAARLPDAAEVRLVPLARMAATSPAQAGLQAALAALLTGDAAAPAAGSASADRLGSRADIVLIMGRLAAQAVLQSNEPLGKLRGRTHLLHGVPAIVTYDTAYLLRNPLDKAKAWDDLCLAMQTVAGQASDAPAPE